MVAGNGQDAASGAAINKRLKNGAHLRVVLPNDNKVHEPDCCAGAKVCKVIDSGN
jgi:hypothetical protein